MRLARFGAEWIAVLALSCAVSGAGWAQSVDYLAQEAGLALDRTPASARLEGMGGLTIAVADEGRELNLSDYGRNLAGWLPDREGRRSDLWFRSIDRAVDVRNERNVRTRTRTGLVETGAIASWSSGSKRLLGAEYAYERLETAVERGERSRDRGPQWGGFGNQRLGPLVVGGAVHFSSDAQHLTTTNPFGISHDGSGVRYTGALAYFRGNLAVGAQVERQVNTILGYGHEVSRFHEDELTWKRPVGIYSAVATFSPAALLRGAVRASLLRIDGRQDVDVSWDYRMPDNPGRANYRALVGAFEEEVRGGEIGSRWDADLTGSMRASIDGEIGWTSDLVTEGVNYKGSRRALDRDRGWTRLVGGLGYALASGRGRGGVEGSFLRTKTEDRVDGGVEEISERRLEVRAGAEYYLRDDIALRAGYARTVDDRDLDAPRTLHTGSAVTIGLGLMPRGGLFQIDALLRYGSLAPDYGGAPNREEEATSLGLGARFLL